MADSKIKAEVDKLLKRNRVKRRPVPVEKIARSLKLDVRFAPLDAEISGTIMRNGDEVLLGVNTFHHPNRQRFTIAHEVGHYVLHKGIQVHVDEDFRVNWRDEESSKAVDWEEIEANKFAAELLMPTDFLRKDIDKLSRIDKAAVQRLARSYKVSSQAMEIRLINLGLTHPL